MGVRVFFCFDQEGLADQRVELVRRYWMLNEGHEEAGIFDAASLKDSTLSGNPALKRLVDENLEHTSVTCVLTGPNTWSRRLVRYAIVESIVRGNRIVAVHINGIPDRAGRTAPPGRNPLEHLALSFTEDGCAIRVLQYASGDWTAFPDNPGWPLAKPTSEQRRGKSLKLSTMYPAYDWIKDNGPANIDRWLGG